MSKCVVMIWMSVWLLCFIDNMFLFCFERLWTWKGFLRCGFVDVKNVHDIKVNVHYLTGKGARLGWTINSTIFKYILLLDLTALMAE